MTLRGTLSIIERDGIFHVISEHYGYKTEPYYTILDYETENKPVLPTSRSVIDAGVVPICLERARCENIPVCEWGISQEYVPLPAIIYGINYFSNNSNYSIVEDDAAATKVINNITNNGKYPFCYQQLGVTDTVESVISIFGKVVGKNQSVSNIANEIYKIFNIPLVTLVFVHRKNKYLLSSLSSAKYSKLSKRENTLLKEYV